MKLLRVGPVGEERPAVQGEDGRLYDLSDVTSEIDGAFLASGGVDRVRAALAGGELPGVHHDGLRIGAPLARPGKIVCIGLNDRDHAEETGSDLPTEPTIFMKASNTLIGPDDEVLVPRASVKTDWEVELAVAIGQTARYLDSPADAPSVIAGYCVANEVSEREFQKERGGTWDKGKSCETFFPLGPWLVTADEVPDPQALGLRLSVNGERRQDGTTADMVFGVHHVVHYVSQFMVLDPGDIISTGTPAGVAAGMPEPAYLRAGDVMELEIDGLGSQRQVVGQA